MGEGVQDKQIMHQNLETASQALILFAVITILIQIYFDIKRVPFIRISAVLLFVGVVLRENWMVLETDDKCSAEGSGFLLFETHEGKIAQGYCKVNIIANEIFEVLFLVYFVVDLVKFIGDEISIRVIAVSIILATKFFLWFLFSNHELNELYQAREDDGQIITTGGAVFDDTTSTGYNITDTNNDEFTFSSTEDFFSSIFELNTTNLYNPTIDIDIPVPFAAGDPTDYHDEYGLILSVSSDFILFFLCLVLIGMALWRRLNKDENVPKYFGIMLKIIGLLMLIALAASGTISSLHISSRIYGYRELSATAVVLLVYDIQYL